MQSVAFPLTNGGVTLIDECDLMRVMKHRWYKHFNGCKHYVIETAKKMKLHRFIMKAKKNQLIDHVNGDGLDNRRCNLRFCNHSQNNSNCKCKRSFSGFKGVSKTFSRKNPWRARIKLNKKEFYLGSFSSKVEAAFAYDNKAIELFGEFARLNFPESIDYCCAAEKIKNSNGRIIKVAFTKRSDGSERFMLCRVGVKKLINGKGLCFNPDDYNMIVVYDMKKRSYRMIPLENIKALWIDKQKYKVA